jgi:manganese transport protein
MLTNSKNEMGKFKNNWIVQLFGWFSVIALTYLNLIGLPDQIESLFPKNLAYLADGTAILLIVLVIALLIWTIFELYRGNRKLSLLNQKLSDS